jgi:complement component 1 Q subcomponent-binding protein
VPCVCAGPRGRFSSTHICVLFILFFFISIRIIFSVGDLDRVEMEEEEPNDPSIPLRTAITVTKVEHPSLIIPGARADPNLPPPPHTQPGNGALTFDAIVQDGVFIIDTVSFYGDDKLATDLSSEADWKRRGLYVGPDFTHLEESLQTNFESFLEERGVDSSLAVVIPDLATWKEQKEYVTWLQNVANWVKA